MKRYILAAAVFLFWLVGASISRPPAQASVESDDTRASAEAETLDAIVYSTPEPTEKPLDDAALIAKAWYGFGRYYSDEVLESFVDFIYNRVEAQLYDDDTIEKVVLRPEQWQGWSENSPVLQPTYDKITEIMADRASGGYRTIPKDCLYFNCKSEGIEYLTDISGGNSWYIGK